MWLKRFTNYILWHRSQALAITFLITFVPVIGIVGILIAALMTLRKGVAEGALFTLAATLPYVVSFFISGNQDPATVPIAVWAAVGVAVLSNVLTWVFAVMLRKQTSWSMILQLAALLGVLVVSVVHLVYPGIADWWSTQLQAYYTQAQTVAGALKAQTAATGPSESQLEAINMAKEYATGLMTAAVLFNAVLQLMVARWWQAIIFNPRSLARELQDIRLSHLAGVLFIVSFVLSYMGNVVVLDVMPILYMLFGAAGLSLIHYLFGFMHSPTTWIWMLVLYIALIFSLPTSMVLVAILALFDVWLNLRQRFKKV